MKIDANNRLHGDRFSAAAQLREPGVMNLGIKIIMESISFWMFFISAIVSASLSSQVIETLKEKYPEKYESIGKPSLWGPQSLSIHFKFFATLYKREWSDLNDSSLNFKGNLLVASLTIGFLSWFFLVLSIVLK